MFLIKNYRLAEGKKVADVYLMIGYFAKFGGKDASRLFNEYLNGENGFNTILKSVVNNKDYSSDLKLLPPLVRVCGWVLRVANACLTTTQASLKRVGEALESTAEGLYKQGASQKTVQKTLNNMTGAMGRSGKAAADGIATGEAVTTGTTEAVLKTDPIQQATEVVKETANQVLDFFGFGDE